VRAGRVVAALDGRDYVVPDDLRAIATEVLSHRLVPAADSRGRFPSTAELVSATLQRVAVPRGSHGARESGAGALPLRGLRG
jgi:MoxR-like ATPase